MMKRKTKPTPPATAARNNHNAPKAAARTTIAVQGARVHNLKNITLEIPRDSLIVVTGLSGSGKSFAIRALEDNGFFCVDNLPALLIPKFIDLCQG